MEGLKLVSAAETVYQTPIIILKFEVVNTSLDSATLNLVCLFALGGIYASIAEQQ